MNFLWVVDFIRSPLARHLFIALACIALIFGFAARERHVQYAKDAPIIAKAKSDLRDEKAVSAGLRLALKASEDKRAVEYSLAVQSAGEADSACAARVAAAHRSANAIRSIIGAPHATDPQTHCPARELVSADQLRDALQPAHP